MKECRLILLAGLLLAGCAETPPAPALHDFGAGAVAPHARDAAGAEIHVIAPKWLSDDRIRYRLLYDRPSRVRFYNLDQWVAPVPELLRLMFVAAGFVPDYALDIQLLAFEQQFEAPDRSSVQLQFSVSVFTANGRRKQAARVFDLRSGAVAPNAQGAVDGYAQVAEQAKRQIGNWLTGIRAGDSE